MRLASIALATTVLLLSPLMATAQILKKHDGILHARHDHDDMHLRARHLAERARVNRRDVLTDAPTSATGIVTVSNTLPAAAGQTGIAKGALRGGSDPLPSCSSQAALGGGCDPTTGSCCATDLTCTQKVCVRLCGINTVEAYCADQSDCDSSLGYTCTNNRCRPPATAVRVDNGVACDQGAGNTAFCIPGRGVCVDGTCVQCVLHA